MADDITLTVRVRDLSQGQLRRLQSEMNRLQRNMHAAGRGATSVTQNFQRLRGDVGRLTTDLSRMVAAGQLTRRELTRMQQDAMLAARGLRQAARDGTITRAQFRALSRDVDVLRARMVLLGREGNVFERLSARLLLLQNRMRESNSHAGRLRRTLSGIGERLTGTLRGAVTAVGSLASGLGKLTSHIKLSGRWTAILLASLVLIGPAAQALGAILTTALGGAFIALGAFALRGSASVKKAFSDMRTSISGDLKAAAEPMQGFLINGMAQVAAAFRQLQPLLQQAFAAAGPLIENFFGAFTDLAEKAMPGIVSTLESLGPVMAGFRTAMGDIGKGIGEMFDAMTSNGGADALGDVWATLGQELRNLLVGIGEFINYAAQSEAVTALMVTAFRTLSGILNIVQSGLSILDGLFGWFLKDISLGANALAMFGENAQAMGDSLIPAGQSLESLRTQLKETEDEIIRIKKAQDDLTGIEGPARKYALQGDNATDDDLNAAQEKRKGLLAAISAAESDAAAASRDHAAAVQSLTEKISNLNNANLARLNARAAMEQSIDDAKKKTEELTEKVRIQNGVFDVTHEATRGVYEAFSKVAENTALAATQAEKAHAPLSEINAIWGRGREQLLALGQGAGISKAEMQAFIETVLQTPESATTKLTAETEEANRQVGVAIEKIRSVPPEAKSMAVFEGQRAMERAAQYKSQLDGLDGRNVVSTVTLKTINEILTYSKTFRSVHDIVGTANGGLVGGYASGGGVQFAPTGMLKGPGTGRSDSILAMFASGAMGRVSNTEFVVNANSTRKYLPLLEAINDNKLKLATGYASGGQVGSAQSRLKDLVRGDSFEKEYGRPDSIASLTNSIKDLLKTIRAAFSGSKESKLVAKIKASGDALLNHEKKLAKVNSSLEKAKDGLDALKSSAASMRSSVRSGVMSATDITRVATGDKAVGMADIMAAMRNSVDKAAAFSKALTDLKNAGFSARIIEQIAEAGIEGGGLETAGTLLTASPADIATLNTAQAQINNAAKAAGNTAADALYGAGIKAAEGLVKGLTDQKKQIEKAMMAIAQAMEKAIKAALGIKSPSKVMQEVGHQTAEGFALGMENNRRVDASWASMLNAGSPGSGGYPAGGSGEQYVIPVYLHGKQVDEIWLDTAQRVIRTRGGDVQKVLGRRTS